MNIAGRMAAILLFMWVCGVFIWGISEIGERNQKRRMRARESRHDQKD